MKWPGYLEQKEILFSRGTSREELIRWGERFLKAGRLHDAVAFYAQARSAEGLQEIRQRAVEEGDMCLFLEALNGMETDPVDSAEWARLAKQAEERGRWHDANRAYEQLGDANGLKRTREAIENMRAALLDGHSPSHGDASGA